VHFFYDRLVESMFLRCLAQIYLIATIYEAPPIFNAKFTRSTNVLIVLHTIITLSLRAYEVQSNYILDKYI
jgi:hypothetical protein